MSGYTYWLRHPNETETKNAPPVIQTDIPLIDHIRALSFLELMELRVVKAFIDKGVSLQRVRTAGRLATEDFETRHPFASRRVFTDGRNIFAELTRGVDTPDVVELTPSHHLQIQSGHLVSPFLEEIAFSEETSMAQRWWPLSRNTPVVLDPDVCFGAPVIDNTGVRTEIAAGMVKATSVEATADAYGLNAKEVHAAVKFENYLLAA